MSILDGSAMYNYPGMYNLVVALWNTKRSLVD
jgi:hypothetical protein